MDEKKQHWENIYKSKSANKLSWTQANPSPSIDWILEVLPDRNSAVIDVGGGISVLTQRLLKNGYVRPAVLDISSSAIDQAKLRMNEQAALVDWIEADVTAFNSFRKFALWHDRAVFHFFTKRSDRELYIKSLKRSLSPGGYVLIATFSPLGPDQCSGLDVTRFDEKALSSELGVDLVLTRFENHTHQTPWGKDQAFTYCLFQFRGQSQETKRG